MRASWSVVIGRRIRNLKEDAWRSAVRGLHDSQRRDRPRLARHRRPSKSMDSRQGLRHILPHRPVSERRVGPRIWPDTRNPRQRRAAPARIDPRLYLPDSQMLAYITAIFTLEPGDLVLTGTPAGVGPLKAGDSVQISIPGLGMLG